MGSLRVFSRVAHQISDSSAAASCDHSPHQRADSRALSRFCKKPTLGICIYQRVPHRQAAKHAAAQPIILASPLVFSPPLSLFPNLVYGCCVFFCFFFPPRWSKINQPICHPPLPPLPLSSPTSCLSAGCVLSLTIICYVKRSLHLLSSPCRRYFTRQHSVGKCRIFRPGQPGIARSDLGKKKNVNGGVNTEEKHRFRSNLVLH